MELVNEALNIRDNLCFKSNNFEADFAAAVHNYFVSVFGLIMDSKHIFLPAKN